MDGKVKGCFLPVLDEPEEWEDSPLPLAIREAIAERLNDEEAASAA